MYLYTHTQIGLMEHPGPALVLIIATAKTRPARAGGDRPFFSQMDTYFLSSIVSPLI